MLPHGTANVRGMKILLELLFASTDLPLLVDNACMRGDLVLRHAARCFPVQSIVNLGFVFLPERSTISLGCEDGGVAYQRDGHGL